MKKIVIISALFLALSVAGKAQQNLAEQYAAKVAFRMKDSLSLTDGQRSQIFNINMQLAGQKTSVWKAHEGNDSLISINLQRIEFTRDSLYRPVLGEEKFTLYLQKKKNLINNN